MPNLFEAQVILIGKQEPVFCEFRDNLGNLSDPTNPQISIYSPSGSTVISNQAMLKESTGVYYYLFTTTSGAIQGYYQAWFSGEIGGLLRTTDYPKPLFVRQQPWNWGLQYEFIRSVRRAIGDMDPSNYRISDQELIYFIKDGVTESETILPMGYSVTAAPDGVIFNKDLTTRAETLFKWVTAKLVVESIINTFMYEPGYINTGDIIINRSAHLATKVQYLKEQQKKIDDLIDKILSNDIVPYEIITYGDGIITDFWK